MTQSNLTSIEKAILILELLGKPPFEYKATDISKALSMNRSSVHRMLQALQKHAFAVQDSRSGVWRIGPAAYHVGSSYLYLENHLPLVNDILVEISEKTKESVGIAVKDGDKIISIFEIEVHQPNKLNDMPGRYFPPNKGCYGKCLMAYQPQAYIDRILSESVFEKTLPNILTTKDELLAEYAKIREQGYCISIDEKGIDILGVGIPIFDTHGQIAACVATAMFRKDGWENELLEIRDLLLFYQKRIGRLFP